MYTLFIDTHFKDVKLAVYKDKTLIESKELTEFSSTSQVTLPAIKDILTSINLTIKDIKKIIVCNGPGSFTGIRLGITIAKTIAYCLNIPIYTINYLQISALNNKGLNSYAVFENNGYYTAEFMDDKMISPITYIKSKDTGDSIVNDEIDYEKLINYPYLEESDCFNANPLYIKTIEVLNKWLKKSVLKTSNLFTVWVRN